MANVTQVHGLKEMLAQLEQLPKEFASKNGGPLRVALAKAATVGKNAAKAKVPVRTGALRDNIVIWRDKRPRDSGVTERYEVVTRYSTRKKVQIDKYRDNKKNRRLGRVGQEFRAAGKLFYARFLEFGAPGRGFAARPFMRPAFEETKGQATAIFKAELQKAINKIKTKLAAKGLQR